MARVRVDLHNHTTYSPDGSLTPAGLLRAARGRGLDCIAITDHNSLRGGTEGVRLAEADATLPRVIPGEEISTTAGEVIGLFLSDEIPPGLSVYDAIRLIREQNGLVYLPHPCDSTRRGSIGFEFRHSVAALADVIEACNGRALLPRFNRKALRLGRQAGKALAAGSDAHYEAEVGTCFAEVAAIPTRDDLVELLLAGHLGPAPTWARHLRNWQFQARSALTRGSRPKKRGPGPS